MEENTKMTRYCPECGHVGDVSAGHINCCPDGNAAFNVPERYAQELRNGFKALIAAPQCLRQNQEPSAAEQAAWHAGLDEGRAQAARPVVVPDDMPSTEANTKYGESYGVDWVYEGKTAAPAAVAWSMPAEPTEQMIEVLMAGEDRLRARHGDDLPKQRAKNRYHALLALAATPAAASPAGWKLVPIEPTAEMLESAGTTDRDGTPATYKTLYMAMVGASPAAAPVVLPEPDAWLAVYEDRDGNSKFYTSTHKDLAVENDTNGKPKPLYTEQQVRALLATGGQAQAVEPEGVHSDPYPKKCPITGRPYFMHLHHPEHGLIPTFGGPYDSYSMPYAEGEPTDPWHERELSVHRYDHDRGHWVEDESIPLRIIFEEALLELQEAAEAAPQAQADARDAQLLAFAVSEIRRDEMTDSELLDAMEQKRIAVVPEYEGPWDAEVYNDDGKPNHRGSGSTPREAIRAAIAAAKGE